MVGNGNVGVGSGNTITAPVSAPVNVCGVSGSVGGYTNSDCQGGAHSNVTLGNGGGNDGDNGGGNGGTNGNGNVTGIGNVSAASGNTITAPISAPINLCSISLALLGFGNSGCEGGATTNVTTAPQGSNGNVTGIGNVGLGSGNTITAPISAPVNVCSVSVAVAGFANSGCKGGLVLHRPGLQPAVLPRRRLHPAVAGRLPRPVRADDCPPPCHGDNCTPCRGHCHGDTARRATPVCHCHGDHCTPPGCHGDHCTRPAAATAATARRLAAGTRTAAPRRYQPGPPSPTRPGR